MLPQPALTRIVAQAIAPLGCALLTGDVDAQGRIRLAGVVARDSAPLLHRILLDAAPANPVQWQVQPIAGPYCHALDALRIAAPPFGAEAGPFSLSLRGGGDRLLKDDYIIPVVRTPDFPSALTLDYFASDGSVSHLAFVAPHELLPPGATFTVGDPHPADAAANLPASGTTGWQVDAPFGTDLIVAIASVRPLFAGPRPDGESTQAYVAALREALATARRRGERVALAVLPVETAPR